MRLTSIAIVLAGAGSLLAACSPPAEAPAPKAAQPAPAETSAAAPAAAAPAGDDPCRLLNDAEVRAVFPSAKAGVRETTREKYGIRACTWKTEAGTFALQRWTAKAGSVDNEIRGLALGFVDPVNPAAQTAVRYDNVPGVGDQAMALVEARDDKRGVLTDAAILVTQRGDQLVELQSQELARGDRGAA
ncbi:MAG: DUF3558 family protein, partial [Caldimonas sp.]